MFAFDCDHINKIFDLIKNTNSIKLNEVIKCFLINFKCCLKLIFLEGI